MANPEIEKHLQELHGKYLEAKNLLEQSGDDPESEPYKSKYKAAEIFRFIDSSVTEINIESYKFQMSILSALMNYELGVVSYETEDFNESFKHLQKSWEIIEANSLKPDCIVLSIYVLNYIGLLWSRREELQKSCDYLKRAELLYGEYKLGRTQCPIDLPNYFFGKNDKNKNHWAPLEKALTLTLYYLAQVYEYMNENETSAKYCHITLKRQLDSKDYEPLDWSLNCATLSQYFTVKAKFNAARHALACSTYCVNEYESRLKKEIENKDENKDDENKDDEKWDQLNRCKADIARCWAKYTIQLLNSSHEKILNKSVNTQGEVSVNTAAESEEFMKVYRLMKNDEVKELENQVTCDDLANFEEAKSVFLFGIKCINESKQYYLLNDFTYDNVQLLQDNSKLYKFLASFEDCPDRKCKMHKRRIDLLEDVLKKLNPQYYLALCRSLMFEIGETYSDILDIKLQIANSEESRPSDHAIKKINYLASKGIEHFTAFVDSLRDNKKLLPETFADDVVRLALVSYFFLGRFYSKMIFADTSKIIEYLKKNESCYKLIVKYIEKNPQHETHMKEELPVIREILELLPNKIEAIKDGTFAFNML